MILSFKFVTGLLRKGMEFVKSWMAEHCRIFIDDSVQQALSDFTRYLAEKQVGEGQTHFCF